MGLVVYLRERLPTGCLIHFMVDLPEKEETVTFDGILGWIKGLKNDPDYNFKGGVRLADIDSEKKWALLDHAYESWKETQEEDIGKASSSK